jgi:hypothetical protein
MTTDGGVLLYGVAEDEDGRPTVPSPIRLEGARERIDQVAQTTLAEPPFIDIREYPSDAESSVGYVAVVIPQSARAPHQVTASGRFYGRGATGNRRLTEGEISRLYRRRDEWDQDRNALLAECVAHAPFQDPGDGVYGDKPISDSTASDYRWRLLPPVAVLRSLSVGRDRPRRVSRVQGAQACRGARDTRGHCGRRGPPRLPRPAARPARPGFDAQADRRSRLSLGRRHRGRAHPVEPRSVQTDARSCPEAEPDLLGDGRAGGVARRGGRAGQPARQSGGSTQARSDSLDGRRDACSRLPAAPDRAQARRDQVHGQLPHAKDPRRRWPWLHGPARDLRGAWAHGHPRQRAVRPQDRPAPAARPRGRTLPHS